jgi:predicted ribonuclease YlaK
MTDVQSKLFVLDTKVILHDSGCIRNFADNDVAVLITVLEELDKFKRGNEHINFQAREFLRRIDALSGDVLAPGGTAGTGKTLLAYIRGRSLQRIFFIVDEAQNLTPHEVKTIITRAGEGTKIVLTGDIRQIDQPYLDSLSNGLSYLINRMVGQPIYAHVTLEKGERSPLADLASSRL